MKLFAYFLLLYSFLICIDSFRFLKIFQFLDGKKDLFEKQLTREVELKDYSKEIILLILALGKSCILSLSKRKLTIVCSRSKLLSEAGE